MARQGDTADLRLVVIFLRALLKWTQEELSRASDVDRGLISDYELGYKAPSRRTLQKLAAAVGLPYSFVETLLPMFRAARLAMESRAGAGGAAEAPGSPGEGLEQAINEAVLPRLQPHLLELAALVAGEEAVPKPEDREGAGMLWEALSGLSPERRRAAIEAEGKYWTWALTERLCSESIRAAAHQADRAAELAHLALRVADLAPGPDAWRHRLQGYVWAFAGNARRVQGDLPGAEEAFACSDHLWQAGASADPGVLDISRLLELKASLRRQQGHYEEALALLDQALLACSTEETRGRILIKKAATLTRRGDDERAIEALWKADSLLAGSQDPRLPWLVRFSLAISLSQLGRYTEAKALLPEVHELAVGLGNELDLIRVVWLTARVAAGRGRRGEALPALEQVWGYFTAKEIAYDAALAALELAVLHLEVGRTGEVKALAEEMVWIFQAQGVHEEALAALSLFCEAARQEAATAELTREILGYLNKARHNPELRFQE